MVGIAGTTGLAYGAYAYFHFGPSALASNVHAQEHIGKSDHEATMAKVQVELSGDTEKKKTLLRRHTEGDLAVFSKK